MCSLTIGEKQLEVALGKGSKVAMLALGQNHPISLLVIITIITSNTTPSRPIDGHSSFLLSRVALSVFDEI